MEPAVTTVPEFPPRLSLLQVYRMYSIWEVRHEILFEMLKSPISRHSTTFRDDKLLAGLEVLYDFKVPNINMVHVNSLQVDITKEEVKKDDTADEAGNY